MARERTVKDALQAYLGEIGEEPLLTAEEEVSLSKQVRKGNSKARDRMIKANLRLVVKIAKNYISRGLSLGDLIEEGNIGLLTAVERFDPSVGTRFGTYSSWWIKRSIRKALLETVKTIKVPASMIEVIAQWKSIETQMFSESGKSPSYEDIADEMGMSPRQLKSMTRLLGSGDVTGHTLSTEFVEPGAKEEEDYVVDSTVKEKLNKVLASIDGRDADILCKYFGLRDSEPMTLQKIGDEYKITRERVRQLVNRALRKLQESMLDEEYGVP